MPPDAPINRALVLRRFLFLFVSTLSHGLLDMLTNGGLGVALFVPMSNERYFFPWRPITVSPIGLSRFVSAWGLRVLRNTSATGTSSPSEGF